MENRQGSGDTARALIRQGATDDEVLELLRFLHPDGKTTLKTVQSYRSRMRATSRTSRSVGMHPASTVHAYAS